MDAYKADERWEKEHPLESSGKGKTRGKQTPGRRRFGIGGGIVGQMS